jgi:hypothetical protein
MLAAMRRLRVTPGRPAKALGGALAALATIAVAQPASARGEGASLGAIPALALLGDLVFTAVDIRLGAESQLPQTNLAAWEGAVGTAGLLGFSVMEVYDIHTGVAGDENGIDVFRIIAASWSGGLAAHGWWTGIAPRATPMFAGGASAVIGANLALSVVSTARLIDGRLWGKPVAVAETVMALSAMSGCTVAMGLDRPNDRGAWVGLAVWSGVLAAHGITSLVLGPAAPPKPPVGTALGLRVVPLVLPGERATGRGVGVAAVF